MSLYNKRKKQMGAANFVFSRKREKNLSTSCFCYDLNTRAEINRPQAIFLYTSHMKNDPWIEKSVHFDIKGVVIVTYSHII